MEQRATIHVDEKGAEYGLKGHGCAHIQACGTNTADIRYAESFCADHPFLLLIRHVPSEAIVFMGRYSKCPESPSA